MVRTPTTTALQTQLQRRFSHNLVITADYTWSKTIDLTDDDDVTNEIVDIYNTQSVIGRSAGWDRTNVFNVELRLHCSRIS